jgi:hypothetical protein
MFRKFFFFRMLYRLWDNVEKYRKAGPATDYIMADTHIILDTQGYKQTLGICDYMNMQQSLHLRISLLRYTKLPVLLSGWSLCLSVQFWSAGFY